MAPPRGAAQRPNGSTRPQAWGLNETRRAVPGWRGGLMSGAGPVTIGIVAGEASGDALGAALIDAVRRRQPSVRFAGIAGPRMEAAGCEAWVPLERLAVRGFAEVVAHLPGLISL